MVGFSDMVNSVKPDERSVMTYVSAYYHAFAGAQQVSRIWKLNLSHDFLAILVFSVQC